MSEALGNNVVRFPPPPGAAQPPMAPQMVPNPAYQQWMQQAQQVQAVMAENAKRTAQFQAAVDLIKKDGIHGFKLDIESDSTIAPDEQAEKQARVEFLQQMVPMLEQVVPMAMGKPALATLAKEMTLFAARGFRVARPLEESLEQAWDAIAQMPPPPPPGQKAAGPTQNPAIEQAKTQADIHDTDVKAQTDQMAIAQKQQAAAMSAQVDMAKLQAEDQRSQMEMSMQAAELQQRERLEAARSMALQSRAAKGLT